AVAVHAACNAYVFGSIVSGTYEEGLLADAFVLKIDAQGGLTYDKSFGGDRTVTVGNAIAADAKGNVYFAGATNDTEITAPPLAGGAGGLDVYVGPVGPSGGCCELARVGGTR